MISQKISQNPLNHQPKLQPKHRPKQWASAAVFAIWFLFEDMYVITAGGTDATLLRWKIV